MKDKEKEKKKYWQAIKFLQNLSKDALDKPDDVSLAIHDILKTQNIKNSKVFDDLKVLGQHPAQWYIASAKNNKERNERCLDVYTTLAIEQERKLVILSDIIKSTTDNKSDIEILDFIKKHCKSKRFKAQLLKLEKKCLSYQAISQVTANIDRVGDQNVDKLISENKNLLDKFINSVQDYDKKRFNPHLKTEHPLDIWNENINFFYTIWHANKLEGTIKQQFLSQLLRLRSRNTERNLLLNKIFMPHEFLSASGNRLEAITQMLISEYTSGIELLSKYDIEKKNAISWYLENHSNLFIAITNIINSKRKEPIKILEGFKTKDGIQGIVFYLTDSQKLDPVQFQEKITEYKDYKKDRKVKEEALPLRIERFLASEMFNPKQILKYLTQALKTYDNDDQYIQILNAIREKNSELKHKQAKKVVRLINEFIKQRENIDQQNKNTTKEEEKQMSLEEINKFILPDMPETPLSQETESLVLENEKYEWPEIESSMETTSSKTLKEESEFIPVPMEDEFTPIEMEGSDNELDEFKIFPEIPTELRSFGLLSGRKRKEPDSDRNEQDKDKLQKTSSKK